MPLNIGKSRLLECKNSNNFRTGSSSSGSSGPAGSVQLSSGSGGPLTHNSDIYVSTTNTFPLNSLVLDSTNAPNGEPITGLVFKKPNITPSVSYLGQEGSVVYGNLLGTGVDFYGWKGNGPWISLTNTGGGATAAGGNKEIQYNSGGNFAATTNFTFDTTIIPNLFTIGNSNGTLTNTTFAGDLNITTSSSTTIAQFDTANGIQMQTTAAASGIDIKGSGSAPINLQTAAGALSLTTATGALLLTSASAGISLNATTAGQTITNITGNIVTELKDDGAAGEFLTMSSNYTGGTTPDFGLRLRDEATYDAGVGASLYLDGTNGINTPRQATLELNTDNNLAGTTPEYPVGKLTRIFAQTPTSTSTTGGYRCLFAAGSATGAKTIPKVDDLGNGSTLQFGEFYIGEARKTGRPHINYNLSTTSAALSGFNIAESKLQVTDYLETKQYVSLGKGIDSGTLYGGNVSVYPTTQNVPEIQLRGDGLATFGYHLGTDLIRLDGTATGASAGGLITLENHSYQSPGNPLGNAIKLDATGTGGASSGPVITIGTAGTGGPVPGKLIITEGINNSIVADGASNGVSIWDGTLTIGSTTNAQTTILGGRNSGSIGLRSIAADGSFLANGICHISYGTWSGTSYDERADLCLGGTPRVIPDTGQPSATENDPDFMIRTQKRDDGTGTGTYTKPVYILNRYTGPQVNFPPIGESRKLLTTMALEKFALSPQTEKNRIQIAGGDPYNGSATTNKYMVNLVSRKPSAPSSTLLPLGAIPGQDPIQGNEQWPITNARDPDDGICLNGDIVINRRRGITIDADTYIGPSWGNAEGPLFIGNINNSALTTGQKTCTISTTYNLGVQIGSDFGLTYTQSNNTGCTINGDVRVGNVASMDVVHQGANGVHTGYVGDGGLFAFNETGLRGSSVYTNILGISGSKMYIAKNLSTAADGTAVIGSCIEGPQGVVMLRGQVELNVHAAEIDLDTCQVSGGVTLIIPHNNPDTTLQFPGWPVGTFAAMFQNPMVNVTNAGTRDPPGATVSQGDAALGVTLPLTHDLNFTGVAAIIKVDTNTNPPTSKLFIFANPAGTPNLVVNYVVYCERKDKGYQPVAGGYPGFTKPYENPITGTTFTFSGTATAAEINNNGGQSGYVP